MVFTQPGQACNEARPCGHEKQYILTGKYRTEDEGGATAFLLHSVKADPSTDPCIRNDATTIVRTKHGGSHKRRPKY